MIQVQWWPTGTFQDVKITNLFCPNCGQKTVYIELEEGDYYEGRAYYCRTCKFDFRMPCGIIRDKLEWKEEQD